MTALTLNLDPIVALNHGQFRQLCLANPDLKLERASTGELIVMSPTGWETGKRNANLTIDLGVWNRQTNLGVVFDSSTGFTLPNGADRSPDVSWVQQERLDGLNLSPADFLPLAPDFVIELRSETDRLQALQAKMLEYRDNGVRLGWLINPKGSTVQIYRLGQETEVLEAPEQLFGEDVLPGFALNLLDIMN